MIDKESETGAVRRELTAEEANVILSGPAVWSNYVYTTYGDIILDVPKRFG